MKPTGQASRSKCTTCGRFLGATNYVRRWLPGTSTAPLGVYQCTGGHKTSLVMPWDFAASVA